MVPQEKQGRGARFGWRLLAAVGAFIALAVLYRFSFSWQLAQIYAEYPFNRAEADYVVSAIKEGHYRPDQFGRVDIDMRGNYGMAFVTRESGQGSLVLIPSYLESETNWFRGYLYSEKPLASSRVVANGPVRACLHCPRARPTHLTVMERMSTHWYHVRGEMYK